MQQKNEKPTDLVNHPAHYTSHPSGVECIDIIMHMPLNPGNAIKYLWRCGLKDPTKEIEDLEKAIKCCQFEINRLKGLKANGDPR